ncbi:MAG TPA: amidase [Anaerolineales bacterium]|nr:amidase [Anaerolineales bacterium]
MNISTTHVAGDLVGLSQRLRSGEMDLLRYLHDLEDVFEAFELKVQAFLPEDGRFIRLRREAERLLSAYPQASARPALFGVPVGVKDIFHVDGFPTQGGSKLPEDRLFGPQAASVSRLKAHGALVLGKTVTTEFAYFAPGPTRNPHHLDHTPGGSSSGSAAAVAAGMVPLALGTQTIGSIIRPAAFCGVIGFKPSRERIARDGVIPLAPSLDHVGFFTTDASGAELAASLLLEDWSGPDITSLKRPVLGIPEGPYLGHVTHKGRDHFEKACRRLEEAGYALKRVSAMADFEEVYQRHILILAAEAAQVHAAWYEEFSDRYHPKTAELVVRGKSVSPEALSHALEGCRVLREETISLMDEHELDLWITPAAPGPAPLGLENTGDPVMNLPWTHAGLPALNIPSGTTSDGLPLGAQFVGRWAKDETLLAFGKMLERDLKSSGKGDT